MQQLEGNIKRVTFQNDETEFTAARPATSAPASPVTVVGNLAGVPVDFSARLSGSWQRDPKFGRQFRVERFTIVKPNTLHGIERYLGSGLIPGIGPASAAKIVQTYGDRANPAPCRHTRLAERLRTEHI